MNPKEQHRIRDVFLKFNPVPSYLPIDLPASLGGPELLCDGDDWSERCKSFVGYFACLDHEKQSKLARVPTLHPSNSIDAAIQRVKPHQWASELRLPDKETVHEAYRRDSSTGVGLLGAFLLDESCETQTQKVALDGLDLVDGDLNVIDCVKYHSMLFKFWERLRNPKLALRTTAACHPAEPETVDRFAELRWCQQSVQPAWRPKSNRLPMCSSVLHRSNFILSRGFLERVLSPTMLNIYINDVKLV